MLAYLDTCIGFAVVMLGVSLIVTILTQMVSAAANFRGASLRWGIQQLFANIDPDRMPTIAAHAEEIAQKLLSHDVTSGSIFSSVEWIRKALPDSWVRRFQLAPAIRSEELIGALKQWAASGKPPLGIPVDELNALLDAKNPVVERQIRLLREASDALGLSGNDKAPALLEEAVRTMRESAGNLEVWFKSSMDRVSQQFSTYMRTWTVVFSFLLALAGGLDAIGLLNSLYRNGDFRAALVGAAPQVMEVAGKVAPAEAKSTEDAVAMAMSRLYADSVTKALASAKVTLEAKPQNIKTRDEAEAWIRQNVTDEAQQKAVMAAFPDASNQATTEFLNTSVTNAVAVKGILTAAGIPIGGGWAKGLPGFLGMLISGGLLSLGAPFWFNALKSLTNLRPTLAGKIKEEEKKSA